MVRSFGNSALFILLSLVPAFTQEGRIAISGTVLDPTGTPVPGTEVILRPSAGTAQRTITDAAGGFRFAVLAAGTYVVEVVRGGFVAASVRVRAGSRSPAPLRIELKLASVRQEITVEANAASISVEAGENRDVVS